MYVNFWILFLKLRSMRYRDLENTIVLLKRNVKNEKFILNKSKAAFCQCLFKNLKIFFWLFFDWNGPPCWFAWWCPKTVVSPRLSLLWHKICIYRTLSNCDTAIITQAFSKVRISVQILKVNLQYMNSFLVMEYVVTVQGRI